MRTELETPCTTQHEVYQYCAIIPGRLLVSIDITLLHWYKVFTFVYYENVCAVLIPTDGQDCCARRPERTR